MRNSVTLTSLLSRDRFFSCLFVLLPVLYYSTLPITFEDLAIWIAVGKHILSTGHLYFQEPFSMLSTGEFVFPFLTTIIYGLLDKLGEWQAVVMFHRCLVAVVCFIIYSASFKRLTNETNTPWTLKNLFFIFIFWNGSALLCIDRPALVAFLPFVLTFLLVQKMNQINLRNLISLACLNIIWVNVHGSWPLLFLMLGWKVVFLNFKNLKVLIKELLLVFVVLLTALINPAHIKIFQYVYQTITISKLRAIGEWAPTKLNGQFYPQAEWFFLLVLIVAVCIFFFKKKERFNILCSPMIPIALFGFFSVRNTVFAFLVFLPFLSHHGLMKTILPSNTVTSKFTQIINNLILGFLMIVILLLHPKLKPLIAFALPENKKATCSHMAPCDLDLTILGPQDRIFNTWELGSYLSYFGKGQYFMDARNIIFSDQNYNEYMTMINAQNDWKALFEKYKFNKVILNKYTSYNKLYSALTKDPDWKEVQRGRYTSIFARTH